MVDLAYQQRGVFGARMTGGGVRRRDHQPWWTRGAPGNSREKCWGRRTSERRGWCLRSIFADLRRRAGPVADVSDLYWLVIYRRFIGDLPVQKNEVTKPNDHSRGNERATPPMESAAVA